MRARRKVENEARKATRARAEGKTLEQLKALVATEYGARGLELSALTVAWHAEVLRIEQRPFGRVRSTLRGVVSVAAAGRQAVRMIRGRLPSDPDWLRPRQRASYPVRTDHTHFAEVEVDADARSWIDRVRADAPRRIGQWALVDAWLTRDEHTDRLVVHIGEHRVGTVQSSHFDRAMTAADLFDEDPVLTARLGPADNPDSTALLELALPRGTTY